MADAALDGLRTIAVYVVVALHGGLASWSGGFVGVDLFFVLSGFLVTSVLLDRLARHGELRLPRFCARRVRRLLPAAATCIVATSVAYVLVVPAAARQEAMGGARAASSTGSSRCCSSAASPWPGGCAAPLRC